MELDNEVHGVSNEAKQTKKGHLKIIEILLDIVEIIIDIFN